MTNAIQVTDQLAGFFKVETIKSDGRRRLAADWQPNLITNYGLDSLGYGYKGGYINKEYGWMHWCSLGTGSTEPAITDYYMTAAVAQVTYVSYTNGTGGTGTAQDPYYRWQKVVYRFAQGLATGTIREIGLGMKLGFGATTSTHALIRDPNGDPTYITITADEQVDITYEIRAYLPDLTTYNLQMTLNSVLYDMKSGVADALGTNNMNGAFFMGGGLQSIYGYRGDTLPNYAYNGGATPWLAVPYNNYGNGTANVYAAYIAGTHYLDAELILPYTSWTNGAKGFTAVQLFSRFSRWQISFTQNLLDWGIPHDNTNELRMVFRHSWARYTPPA